MKTDPEAAVQLPRPDLHDLGGVGGPRVAEETHERQCAHGRMVTPAERLLPRAIELETLVYSVRVLLNLKGTIRWPGSALIARRPREPGRSAPCNRRGTRKSVPRDRSRWRRRARWRRCRRRSNEAPGRPLRRCRL